MSISGNPGVNLNNAPGPPSPGWIGKSQVENDALFKTLLNLDPPGIRSQLLGVCRKLSRRVTSVRKLMMRTN